MVWLYVIGYIVMGVIAIMGEVYMTNHHYSHAYRCKMKTDKTEVFSMMIGCMLIWWLVIPFHFVRLAIVKIQKVLQ
ncbi:hypothetical protein D3C80_1462400 [compost metagenome]